MNIINYINQNARRSIIIPFFLIILMPIHAQVSFNDRLQNFFVGLANRNDVVVAEEGVAIIDIVNANGLQWDTLLAKVPFYTAFAFENLKNVGKAISCAEYAKENFKDLYGIYSWQVAESYNYLSTLYAKRGDVNSEIVCMKSILVIADSLVGEKHNIFYNTLGKIAVEYARIDSIELVLIYLEKQYEIIESLSVIDSLSFANCTYNLARMYQKRGLMDEAFLMYQQSEDFSKCRHFKSDYQFVRLMQDYALFLVAIGDYGRAANAINNALDLVNSKFDFDYRTRAHSLGIKSKVKYFESDYDTSRNLSRECIDLYERNLDGNHPGCMMCKSVLAQVYFKEENYDEALIIQHELIEYCSENSGEMSVDFAVSINNLAQTKLKLRDYEGSKLLYAKALDVLIENAPTNYDAITGVLSNLICLHVIVEDYALVKNYLKLYWLKMSEYLDQNFSLSNQMLATFKNRSDFSMCYYSIIDSDSTLRSSDITIKAFNDWNFLNGLVFTRGSFARRNGSEKDKLSLVLRSDLLRQRAIMADYYAMPAKDLVNMGVKLSWEEEVEATIETKYFSHLQSIKNGSISYAFRNFYEIINEDEAYIDILRVPYFDFMNIKWTDSLVYKCYVVTSETRSSPLLVSIGDGKQIDEILYPYLVGQTTNPTSTTMDGQVYDLLWKPLEEHLAGKTKIYLSPGGIYHSINPETIYHAETGKYLFEEKEIHLVNSGRSFVDQRIYGNRDYTDKTAFIIGAPNFDYAYVADSTLLEDNVSFTYQTKCDLSLDGNRRVAPLPATRSEVEGINQTLMSTGWNTKLHTGNDALESNLKQMESPRILHIATHGYFLEDVKPENDNGMRMMGMDVQRVAENPMLRSGLLLAGCNKTLADNTPLAGGDNGILTAYEAGLLDLSKTELVVLSACETGKGEILNGEGVQGLRKAMTDAGAEHILMSLWKVDDKVTSEYMQTFYGHYAQGKSIRESYNLTRNEIKQKYPQPYYWGAFVLVGE